MPEPRLEFAIVVVAPKVAPFKVTANGPNCGWLNTLNMSTWKRRRIRSVNGKSRCSEKSNSWSGNARTTLRPRVPEITWLPTAGGAAQGQARSPCRDRIREYSAFAATTIAISSHDARGTTRNTEAGFGRGGPRETSP